MGYRTYTCPIARDCGGCEWLAVPYTIQLRRKQEKVKDLLGAMIAADKGELRQIVGTKGEPLSYRHKAATPYAHAGRGRITCGFYARGSHRIVRCNDCLAEDPRARHILNAVGRAAELQHIPAYDEDKGMGVLRHAVVRCGYATDDVLLTVVTNVAQLRQPGRFVSAIRRPRSPASCRT